VRENIGMKREKGVGKVVLGVRDLEEVEPFGVKF
jgi:hypothetical protein